MALACFARKPITVRARLVSCNCDMPMALPSIPHGSVISR